MNILYILLRPFIYILFVSFFCTNVFALSSDWSVGDSAKVRIISPYSQNNNKELLIGLEYEMDPGWKTYWKSPGDGGFAQNILWENSSNINNLEILWPTPEKFQILGLTSLGYQNNVIFPLKIEITDESKDTFVNLQVNFLICKEICIPGDARVILDIPAGNKELSDNIYIMERALSFLPEHNFDSSYIKNINASVYKDNKNSLIKIIVETEKSFFNTNFFLHTPFGLPVVKNSMVYSNNNKLITAEFKYAKDLITNEQFPIEIIIQDENHNFINILDVQVKNISPPVKANNNYIYYILISLLAGLILNVMPCVFPILSIKLMSVFSSGQKNARVSFLTTAFGIIFSFILLGLIFLFLQYFKFSISWGMQFQQPYFLIFITLVIFLFMMNMFNQFEINPPSRITNFISLNNNNLYLKDFFNGFFATLMATPCSAPFVGTAITAAFTQNYLIGINIFLFMGMGMSSPYLLVAIFPKLVNFLPKPGKWMIYVKFFLGLLLLATVIWLSNILLNFFTLSFLVLFLILFLILSYRKKIPYFKNIITILILLSIFYLPSVKSLQNNPALKYDERWLNFFEVDINQLVIKDEVIFLDITADWCATCQFNKVNVLNSNKIIKLFEENNILLVRADWTRPNKKINVFLEKYKRFGIPFNAFFSKNFPDGVLLSELLSEKEILEVINKIKYE
ncbi:MAG: protein-disulfide reductase DsbD family protein [Alphaproteobacteria bacterium]